MPPPGDPKAAWALWHALEASHLNWSRNGISATGVGLALVQWRADSDKPPLAGALLIGLGLASFATGGALFATNVVRLRHALCPSPAGWLGVGLTAVAPTACAATAASCLCDAHPRWLVDALKRNRGSLPEAWRPQVDNL